MVPLALPLAACDRLGGTPTDLPDAQVPTSAFPAPHRPVAPVVSNRWSTEAQRDSVNEAALVMDLGDVKPGMTVADIGAGEGYYTVRLAPRVGEKGRVLAQDISADARNKLAERVIRDSLDNVSVKLGLPNDPKLPPRSFDRIFMVHMYHEIQSPYEFMWRLRPSLARGGRVIIVDSDRPTTRHGIPPALLECEVSAAGYRTIVRHTLPQPEVFLRVFEAAGKRPEPGKIRRCDQKNPAE